MDAAEDQALEEEQASPPRGRWCLVANISKEYANANRPGKPRFGAGTKVYVDGPFCGDGWENTHILAQDRRSRRWFVMILDVDWLCNFRATQEYSPSLQKRLDEHGFIGGYDDNVRDICSRFVEGGQHRALALEVHRVQRRYLPEGVDVPEAKVNGGYSAR